MDDARRSRALLNTEKNAGRVPATQQSLAPAPRSLLGRRESRPSAQASKPSEPTRPNSQGPSWLLMPEAHALIGWAVRGAERFQSPLPTHARTSCRTSGNGGGFVDFRYRVDSAAGAPEIDIVFRDDA